MCKLLYVKQSYKNKKKKQRISNKTSEYKFIFFVFFDIGLSVTTTYCSVSLDNFTQKVDGFFTFLHAIFDV